MMNRPKTHFSHICLRRSIPCGPLLESGHALRSSFAASTAYLAWSREGPHLELLGRTVVAAVGVVGTNCSWRPETCQCCTNAAKRLFGCVGGLCIRTRATNEWRPDRNRTCAPGSGDRKRPMRLSDLTSESVRRCGPAYSYGAWKSEHAFE